MMQFTQVTDWIPIAIALAGAVATVATVKQQARESERRHAESQAGQVRIWQAVDVIRTDQVETQVRLEAFRTLEEERHQKSDIAVDELKGDVRRMGKDIQDVRLWQSQVTEQLKQYREGWEG